MGRGGALRASCAYLERLLGMGPLEWQNRDIQAKLCAKRVSRGRAAYGLKRRARARSAIASRPMGATGHDVLCISTGLAPIVAQRLAIRARATAERSRVVAYGG